MALISAIGHLKRTSTQQVIPIVVRGESNYLIQFTNSPPEGQQYFSVGNYIKKVTKHCSAYDGVGNPAQGSIVIRSGNLDHEVHTCMYLCMTLHLYRQEPGYLACKDNAGAVDGACTIGGTGVRDTKTLCEAADATNGSKCVYSPGAQGSVQ